MRFLTNLQYSLIPVKMFINKKRLRKHSFKAIFFTFNEN